MAKTPPFLRVELVDVNGAKMVVIQQNFGDEELHVETTARSLTVKRRDLQLALLSIVEEG